MDQPLQYGEYLSSLKKMSNNSCKTCFIAIYGEVVLIKFKGGLWVIDINKFIVALKITWLRRYFMYNTKYFKLVKVICPCISDFVKFGSDYSKLNLNAIDNVFWKNVIEGYIQFNN